MADDAGDRHLSCCRCHARDGFKVRCRRCGHGWCGACVERTAIEDARPWRGIMAEDELQALEARILARVRSRL